MTKLFALILLSVTTTVVNAQETRPQVPPPKNVLNVNKPQLPQQLVKPIPIPANLDPVASVLTSNTWNLTRWWITGNVGHSDGGPGFKFNTNGTVSCNFWIADAKGRFESGTYTRRDNNIIIQLKKGSNMLMDCNLVYNQTDKTITGSYTLQILPITNTPPGYTPPTITH